MKSDRPVTPGRILASNRDEFLTRATTPAGWHHFDAREEHIDSVPSVSNPILSGIDADPSGGGTWLGITRDGRWAALTNFTEGAPPPLPVREGLKSYRSRGTLVRRWLSMSEDDARRVSAEDFAREICRERDEYPGFNLLVGKLHPSQLAYVTNRNQTKGDDPQEVTRPQADGKAGGMSLLSPQASSSSKPATSATATASLTEQMDIPASSHINSSMGLSNSVLHEPWPKIRSGRAGFDMVIDGYSQDASEQRLLQGLFGVMATANAESIAERKDLQCTVLVPPISLPTKKDPSVRSVYATRTTTILLVKPNEAGGGYAVTMVERDVHVLDAATQREAVRVPADDVSAWRRFDFVTCPE